MNTRILPLALFGLLVGVAVPAQAGTATPLAPVRVEVVDENTLDGIRGKFFGADMLVGLRINLLSDWRTAGGSMSAIGALQIERGPNGEFIVSIYTDAKASADNAAGALLPGATASGGELTSVNGIGQITQVAGDGNRFSNRTTITFVPSGSLGALTPGAASSSSSNGNLTAQVSFGTGGMTMGLFGPGGVLQQTVGGAGGGLMQIAQVAGQDQIGSNTMQLQMMTATMPALMQQQMGIYQALAGMQQLPR